MINKPVIFKMLRIVLAAALLDLLPFPQASGQNQDEDLYQYRIDPIYIPPLKRPLVSYSLDQLHIRNICGVLSTFDGEQFQLYFEGRDVITKDDAARLMQQFLESLQIPLKLENQLRLRPVTTTEKTDENYLDEQIRAGQEATKKKLSGEFSKVSKSSNDMIDEVANDIRKQGSATITIYGYDQYFENTPIDNTSINIAIRNQNDIASLYGSFYVSVKPTNKRTLSAVAAIAKAVSQLKSQYKTDVITGDVENAMVVLLPYEDGFKYVWRTTITADGPYKARIDAETGKILQLLPDFFFADNASGLVFNPDPNAGTAIMRFEVDAPSGGKYTLKKTGAVVLTNNGADGTTGVVTVNDDGSGFADFNVSPINGTTVERTNQSGYNGLFQQVNVFSHIFNERRIYMFLGSQDFGQVNVSFNNTGGNAFCCPPKFHIGTATVGTSTSCSDVFNSGIDATVIAHEFGHRLNGMQYGVGGGSMTGAINEGLADFWACTNFNTDIFGGWWGHNCPTPVQSGFTPRQSEPLDIFPEHSSLPGASLEVHSAGQIISWAMWSARQGMNDAITFGTLSINLNAIKAMTTAGSGVLLDGTAKSVHDSYRDLLRQLIPLYSGSRLIHKLLSGYARAGITLSPKDAVIDIDHSYLDRNNAVGPTFTIWTGEDYTFNSNNSVNTASQPFNTSFMVEVANDEAFTVNLNGSGWKTGVVSGAGGTAAWVLPTQVWNVLKAGDAIFYRVTTRDGNGGSIRQSWHPGNNICLTVPVGKAAINGTGRKDCSCSAAGGSSNSAMALLPVIIIGVFIAFRRRLRKNEALNKNETKDR